MDSILYALQQTVPCGHAARLADKIGVSQTILSNKVNPNNEHHHLTVIEMCRLLPAADDYRAFHAIADKLGFRIVKKDLSPDHEINVISLFLKSNSESADVSRTVGDAITAGAKNPRQASKSIKEIDEAIEALLKLKEGIIVESNGGAA